ncbi:hypothetical protein TNCV_2020081 [Trichonephila clavipes]|nr:hypothetical protein TNCV_2020081 [Trichonephila clavipes]
MPPRRNKEKFQQLTEFERRRIIGLREGGFSYSAIGARVQRNSSTVMRLEVVPFLQGNPGAIFQQDNARPHVAKTVRDFCSTQHMQLLPWPAYSPDMSPIKHVWDLVGQRLARDPRPATSKDEQAIHQNDHQARRRFVEWAQNEIAVVPDFHKRILFSDEAHFWLNGYINIWSEANPQVYVETPLHPEKLTVWCALWAGGILLQKR